MMHCSKIQDGVIRVYRKSHILGQVYIGCQILEKDLEVNIRRGKIDLTQPQLLF